MLKDDVLWRGTIRKVKKAQKDGKYTNGGWEQKSWFSHHRQHPKGLKKTSSLAADKVSSPHRSHHSNSPKLKQSRANVTKIGHEKLLGSTVNTKPPTCPFNHAPEKGAGSTTLSPVIKVPEHNCILPGGTTIAAKEGSLSCHTSEECVIQADFKNKWFCQLKERELKEKDKC